MKAQTIARRTFVTFITVRRGHICGVGEETQVTDRNPHQELFFPPGCIGFVFYDRDVVTVEREAEDGDGPTNATSEAYNLSGNHYRIGRELNAESPQDRMTMAMVGMGLGRVGVPGSRLAEIHDPDRGGVVYILPFREKDVIVREPPPPSEGEQFGCGGCEVSGFCSGMRGSLPGGMLHFMFGGRRRRERPAPDTRDDSKQDPPASRDDSKQNPAAAPAE